MSKVKSKIYSKFFGSTFGQISLATFFIAGITGIFLAIFYDTSNAYDSVSSMLITNPSASFLRSLHYWSSQLFLIFTILHTWDHLRKSTETNVKNGVWIRLAISIIAIFFVMLSGFILKGDADSLQAKRILTTLLDSIPLIGNLFSYSLMGSDESFQLVYVHHIATATIFIFIIIIEHAKQIWPKSKTTIYFLIPTILLSIFFIPNLHNGIDSVMKGPWYFLGMQELFHYFSSPEIVLWLSLFVILIFALLPKFNDLIKRNTKVVLLVLGIIYILLSLVGYFFRGTNWEFRLPWNNEYFSHSNFNPINNGRSLLIDFKVSKEITNVLGRNEGCQYCHESMEGFSPSHDPKAIGCVACHLGNSFTIDNELAHSGMIKIPGNLETAHLSCGSSDCHPGISERVEKSIMNTMSGVVTVNRFVFGEETDLNKLANIKYIGTSAADTHLRNLCASCHTGNEKTEYGPITELSRGGGCNACHLNYDEKSKNDLAFLPDSKGDSSIVKFHPSLTLNVSNDHCFGCHSRSGRISTSYEGWHETSLTVDEVDKTNLRVPSDQDLKLSTDETQISKEDFKNDKNHRLLEDGRVFKFVSADIHHTRGMECIDCHNSYELMGNGTLYAHQNEQTSIECEDCHADNTPIFVEVNGLDAESQKIIKLRGFEKENRKYLVTRKDSIPLINTYVKEDNSKMLIGKNSKREFELKPPNFICEEGKAHNRLSCNSCHTAWAPQCVGCHTEFDSEATGYDNLTKTETNGAWREMVGEFYAEPPTLGIMNEGSEDEKIETFVPGMIMTLDKSNFTGEDEPNIFHRLFAPAIAHTTSAKGLDCKACHNNPLAIGYGRGKLIYSNTGKWSFENEFAIDENDNLPQDAWIGFLSNNQGKATRAGSRPFTIEEQKQILTVGACLTCHKEDSKIMIKSLSSFDKLLKQVSTKCVLPVWD
jgi:quinol-cytochrome oxidoreductase complex cytochrome b subunit